VKLNGFEFYFHELKRVDNDWVNGPRFSRNPVLVFLNGCRAAPPAISDDTTVLGYLLNRSKSHLCCVASVGKISATFVADFANHFFRAFVGKGEPIDRALRRTREAMYTQWTNPLGLLYILIGPGDMLDRKTQKEVRW
jgi:hypothetical protein